MEMHAVFRLCWATRDPHRFFPPPNDRVMTRTVTVCSSPWSNVVGPTAADIDLRQRLLCSSLRRSLKRIAGGRVPIFRHDRQNSIDVLLRGFDLGSLAALTVPSFSQFAVSIRKCAPHGGRLIEALVTLSTCGFCL